MPEYIVFIFRAHLGVMLQPTQDRPIADLYDQVRTPPLRTALDKPAGIGLIMGIGAMLFCMALALAAVFLPHLLGTLRALALTIFCVGLIALIASGVLSLSGMATGLKNRVHIHRFDEEHAQMRTLASDLISRRTDVGELLGTVQFQLRKIARIHDQLPVLTGLITGVATATSIAFQKNSALGTEDLAWIAAGVGLGAVIARALAYQIQDRLMRVEHVLNIAAQLPHRMQPSRDPQAKGRSRSGTSDGTDRSRRTFSSSSMIQAATERSDPTQR